MLPGGYGPGSRYEKGGRPLVYRTNFQGSHRLKQSQSTCESKNKVKKLLLQQYSVALSLIVAIVC